MDSWNQLNIRLQMEALISQREGMIAENLICISLGRTPPYSEDSFQINASEFIKLLEVLRK